MLIKHYITDLNKFKQDILDNSKIYVSHSDRNGITKEDIRLCLSYQLSLNNYQYENIDVFKLYDCVNVINNYMSNVKVYDIYLDKEFDKISCTSSDSDNPFFDVFKKNNCSCDICNKINKFNLNIKDEKLDNLIFSINL